MCQGTEDNDTNNKTTFAVLHGYKGLAKDPAGTQCVTEGPKPKTVSKSFAQGKNYAGLLPKEI